jgi:hypothetical protein
MRNFGKFVALFLLLTSLIFVAAVAYGKNQEKAREQNMLLNSTFFGDFRKARKIKDQGKVSLKVWDPYLEYLQKFPPPGENSFLKGNPSIHLEYDEIWTSERESYHHFGKKKGGKPYLIKLYWQDGKALAFTVEKYYTADPVTFRNLEEPGYRLILIHDGLFILQELFKQVAKETAFNRMTPAAHLQEAKKALAEGNPQPKDLTQRTYGRVAEARHHLEAITKDDPEYGEAQKLLKEVAWREQDLKKYREVMEQAARAEMVKRREKKVEELDRDFLSKGLDVKIELSGSDKSTIKMECVLFSRPWVYVLVDKTDLLKDLKGAGFKEVIFSNKPLKYSWEVDLTD